MKKHVKGIMKSKGFAFLGTVSGSAIASLSMPHSSKAISSIKYVDIDKLNDLNAICFDGTNNWINTMKEVVPNWTFIAAGVENFDVALLKGKNYIFINTKVNSHGMYYKIIENKDKNSKIRYINAINRDRILKEIEKEIEQ